MSYPNELHVNIELLREELLSLAKIYGTTSDIVIKKSQELDVLILKEMKLRVPDDITSKYYFPHM